MLFVSEPTVIGDDAPDTDCVAPPSLDVQNAVKLVIAVPPVPFAVKATVAELLPWVREPSEGAAGVVAATNEVDAADARLSAMVLLATTRHE